MHLQTHKHGDKHTHTTYGDELRHAHIQSGSEGQGSPTSLDSRSCLWGLLKCEPQSLWEWRGKGLCLSITQLQTASRACVGLCEGLGGTENISHTWSLVYMLGPVRLTWVWGEAFIHKNLFHSQGGLKNLASNFQASGILESLVAREVPSCDLIWSHVYQAIIYVKYYKYHCKKDMFCKMSTQELEGSKASSKCEGVCIPITLKNIPTRIMRNKL